MAFTFKLEHPDGTPADPPTLKSAVPNWEVGDQIPLGPGWPPLLLVRLRNASDPSRSSGRDCVRLVSGARLQPGQRWARRTRRRRARSNWTTECSDTPPAAADRS